MHGSVLALSLLGIYLRCVIRRVFKRCAAVEWWDHHDYFFSNIRFSELLQV